MSCVLHVVGFDFANKTEVKLQLDEAKAAMDAGKFVWIDCAASDVVEARQLLSSLGLFSEDVLHAALHSEPATQHARYDEYLHLVVSGCRPRGTGFDLERVDVVIAERFLATVHRGPVQFLTAVQIGSASCRERV